MKASTADCEPVFLEIVQAFMRDVMACSVWLLVHVTASHLALFEPPNPVLALLVSACASKPRTGPIRDVFPERFK